MVNSQDFAKRLELIFEYYDLNASAFADKIDVGRASISHLISGRNKPSLDFVMRVVKTFPEVELYWLLNGKGKFPHIDDKQDIKKSPSALPDSSQTEKTSPQPQIVESRESSNSSDIERIVIFYKNGSFKAYTPD